jgi:hypothetical protein
MKSQNLNDFEEKLQTQTGISHPSSLLASAFFSHPKFPDTNIFVPKPIRAKRLLHSASMKTRFISIFLINNAFVSMLTFAVTCCWLARCCAQFLAGHDHS